MNNIKKHKGRKGQKGSEPKFGISFKRKVAKDYHQGDQSTRQLAQFYNISHKSVLLWARQFSGELAGDVITAPMTEQEKKEFEALKKQNKALQKKLDYEQLKNFALETMVDIAKEELGIDLRKNFGAKQPGE
jgi:transposase-like protein